MSLRQTLMATVLGRLDGMSDEQLFELAMNNGEPVAVAPPREPMTNAAFRGNRRPVLERRTFPAGNVSPDRNAATRAKRGPQSPSVVYVVNTGKRGAQPAVDDDALFPTARKAWNVIRKARKGLSAREIENATGMKRKTVESVLYHLRHVGAIRSERVNGDE